jgi:hypothetical protein
VPFEFKVRGLDRIGMRLETKVEVIKVHDYIIRDPKQQMRYAQEYEVDGWEASYSDFENGHNYSRSLGKDDWTCKVHMYRYIKDKEV